MTREETVKIMAVLKVAYPSFYRSTGAEETRAAVSLWASLFEEEPYELVSAAVKAHIASDAQGFPPHIGAIKEAIRKLSNPYELSEMEAWGAVMKALRNSGYSSAREFEALPRQVQQVVGDARQLREWALMDREKVNTVVQSNFLRSYRARVKSDREYEAIPTGIRQLAGKIAAGRRLPSRAGRESGGEQNAGKRIPAAIPAGRTGD